MIKEEFLEELMKAAYQEEELNPYDFAAKKFSANSTEFLNTKSWADQLIRDKLCLYIDNEHTILQLSNFGKYWMMKGGYASFLKDGQSTRDPNKKKDEEKISSLRKEKEELVEARLRLTHYRLVGFWLTIVISSMGFLLSLYNLYLILSGK